MKVDKALISNFGVYTIGVKNINNFKNSSITATKSTATTRNTETTNPTAKPAINNGIRANGKSKLTQLSLY